MFDALQRLAEEERLRDAMQCGIYSAQSVAEESANEIVSRMSAREFSVPENLDVTVNVYWDTDTMSWAQTTRVKQNNGRHLDTIAQPLQTALHPIAGDAGKNPIKKDTFWMKGSDERSVTFTKPVAFKLGEKRYEVSSWRELLASLCQILKCSNPNDKMEMNADQIRKYAVYFADSHGYRKNKISFQLRSNPNRRNPNI